MLTEEKLITAREEIHFLQEKQDKIFDELCQQISDKHNALYPDINIQLEDFLYNNIYYSGKDINNFLRDLTSKEIILERN